ncbi:MAG: sialate O-acetylesterase [Hyphomonadaceae bacterium]|nr:sialate O-acetylesterase [Hyphomonadaceae bacterium]
MRHYLFAIAAALVLPGFCLAQPTLDGPLTDHGVLQQGREIALSGRAVPGEMLELRLGDIRVDAVVDATGHWTAELPAMSPGGPHLLSLTDSSGTTQLEDLLVGDVWLCSGQSNMAYPVYRALNPDREIAGPHSAQIRLLTVPQSASPVPLTSFPNAPEWTHATPETVRDFSAVCYFTGRELHETLDVPVGLVNASWGGSQIEAWLPAETLREVGGFEDQLELLDLYAQDPGAAMAAFGAHWEAWWTGHFGSQPWNGSGAEPGWRAAPEEMADWKTYDDPEADGHMGRAWFALEFFLTPDQAAQSGMLSLGAFDDVDATWLNGEFLGSTFGWGDARFYDVQLRALKPGANTIYINVLNTWGLGGMLGPKEEVKLVLDDGSEVPLGLGWRYSIVANEGQGDGPRVPWESIGGFTSLYNAMMAPLGDYPMHGGIWYQGETNAGRGEVYAPLLAGLTADWRARHGADLPVVVVQLPNFGALTEAAGAEGWAVLREAQRQVALAEDLTGLAVTIDAGDRMDIHPPNKQLVAQRVADVALGLMGQAEGPLDGVAPLGVLREGTGLRITMPTDELKTISAAVPTAMALCDTEGVCAWADAVIAGADILVRSGEISVPSEVRYCWGDAPICNLYTSEDLPVAPFRLAVE